MPTSSAALPAPSQVLQLLAGAEALSRERDLRTLFRLGAEYAMRFLDGRFGLFFQVRFTPPELTVGLLGCCVSDGADTHWDDVAEAQSWLPVDPLLAVCLHADHGHAIEQSGDIWRVAFAVGALGDARWALEIQTPRKPSKTDGEALSLFLRCFENVHRQWEYANLDTLTRLLNRKTFDDDFDRLIAAAELAEQARQLPQDRRDPGLKITQPCWLAVVDIDHFKHINDTYGHLFGDEVLLRLADLMRQSFRNHDKLFRFGGEEFVIMLRNVSEDHVQPIFDRFRMAVDRNDFPRVGHVACSIGFTRIDPRFSPAELLGRADEALYFSKEHGRNQVNGFDTLIMSGQLRLSTPAGQAQIQSDVDEIFL
ncbi:MAG TPA: GGDEF domain-containing protein [Rhodocyclaceae bacterium]|uniref:GGDEF domain-containing protein n=1 Tax=Zoogloea sp. TaxID=49181 RepID=UPI002C6AB422|nr:GGDEF domain-containing protein [Zoogloea sp.]HMV18829.1 GGDEF domain-containing protein [Rhodocyclaceae bacterium]HMV64999.1 GGDEF domain-containing protein [Rhodocyclaceae bacterium]HMY50874.1 GGDEF domain-containing protein [Rhodocyclaceae bacterium]HNA66860.1 GGDEF domain-containing protein [Rhodocyclaceae bacterium]HNB65763.1 GGDEF domain-containing protein [Rhodocyclaceae bacterium]